MHASEVPGFLDVLANLFFAVFYSYQRESPSSDFSLKSSDGKSFAQDME